MAEEEARSHSGGAWSSGFHPEHEASVDLPLCPHTPSSSLLRSALVSAPPHPPESAKNDRLQVRQT